MAEQNDTNLTIRITTMAEQNEFNLKIIAEFRENKGVVGGMFAGAPMALLTTKGAKSGTVGTTPLVYMPDGDRVVLFASMGGAPKSPAWYHNMVAHPDVTLEVGVEKFEATARMAVGAERDELYARQAAIMPQFAEYQKNTTRVIPVVVLSRK